MHPFVESRPSARSLARAHALATLRHLAAATAVLGALTACGGGGAGDTPAPPPPGPSPAPTPSGPIAAQMSVPTPVGYDADRLAAFNRINEIRLSAGLGMLTQNRVLDQAAQAHADWEISNNTYGHVEQAGTSGFTGVNWWDRDEGLGYTPIAGEEVIASGYGAVSAMNGFVNVAYHRIGVLAIEPVDVGIGRTDQATSNVSEPMVVDIAVPGGDPVRSQGQSAQDSTNGVVIWPIDGAASVSTHMGDEAPNPVPGVDVNSLGTPISITVASSRTIQVTTFSLKNSVTGATVPTYLLTHLNDPNDLVPISYIAAIPLSPLEANASYTVVFEGSVLEPYVSAPTPLSRTWRFSTGPT